MDYATALNIIRHPFSVEPGDLESAVEFLDDQAAREAGFDGFDYDGWPDFKNQVQVWTRENEDE